MEMRIRQVGFNHYVIEPASEEARAAAPSVCVEGEAHEFRDLGYAIMERRAEAHPCAAVSYGRKDVYFFNPRQRSDQFYAVPRSEAEDLAAKLKAI